MVIDSSNFRDKLESNYKLNANEYIKHVVDF